MFTEDHVKLLRTKMPAARAALIEVARGLTREESRRGKPDRMENGEEGYSPMQQLHHLLAAEPLYRERIIAAVENDHPDFSKLPVPFSRFSVTFHNANEHSVSEVLAVMDEERAKTEKYLDTLGVDDYSRTGVDPFWGEMTVMQVARSYYRHDGMHRMQILGVEPEYQPSGVAAEARGIVFFDKITSEDTKDMTWGDWVKRADELVPFLSKTK